MKALSIFSILATLIFSAQAQATGMVRIVHTCADGSGEYHSTVDVKHFSTSPPGGPIHSWMEARVSSSWLGGTYDSGFVVVQQFAAADGGPVLYLNKQAKFTLNIKDQRGVNNAGRAAQILADAKFVDVKTKRKVQLSRRTIKCQ